MSREIFLEHDAVRKLRAEKQLAPRARIQIRKLRAPLAMLVALLSPALPARRKAGQPTRTLQQQEEQMATRSPQLCSFSLPLPSPEAFYVVRASGPTLVASTTVRGGAAP